MRSLLSTRLGCRPAWALPLVLLLLWPWGVVDAAGEADNRPVKTVGVILDGLPPGQRPPGLQPFLRVQEQIREETIDLTRVEFDVRFPEDKQVSGNWSTDEIHAVVDRMLEDPEVDVLLTLGVFSSNDVLRRKSLPKPVVAPFAVDVNAQSLPFAGNTSGVANLNYLTRRGSVLLDLQQFKDLVPFTRLHVLVDSLFFASIPELKAYSSGAADSIRAEAILVPVGDSADPALAALEGAEAAYITPMLRLPDPEFQRIIDRLIERGVPSFSLQGEVDVNRGVLAGLRRATDTKRLARRVALNVQRILAGEDAGSLPVTLDQPEKLLLNMETAEAIGFHPTWRVALEADMIGEEGPWRHRLDEVQPLSLGEAVHEAVHANLALSAAYEDVTASRENIRLARSNWKPRVDVDASGVEIDADRATVSFGTQPERSLSGGVTVSQVLYSEGVASGLDVAKHTQRAAEWDFQSRRFDVALAAATGFLDVLRAQTLEQVELENLELTESNLELARRREAVGFSGSADVYRWESQLATDRAVYIAAHNRVHQAFIVLNQVLNRPLGGLYELTVPGLEDPQLVTGFGRLNTYVNTAAGFELFVEFSVREGLALAPELQGLDDLLHARERQLLAARRSYWVPDVGAAGDYVRRFAEGGAGSDPGVGPIEGPDRDRWTLALQATLPVYAGGARKADVRQSGAQLAGLRLERDAGAQRVEQRVRSAMYDVASTFPAIDLSREAATAARKNLDLVTDSYSRGAVSVIELLDAQNQALIAEQFASNAVYNFLIDLMELQRATGDFDFFRSDEGRQAWFDRLDAFFKEAGSQTRRPER